MIRFISAQTSNLYFAWQVEVMLNNFMEMGVDLKYVDIVCTKENNKIRIEIFWKSVWGLFVSNININLGCKGSCL